MDFLHHAKAFGANDILVKPFSESELVDAVGRLTAD
jgi:FixJ family two-component response regulator